MLTAFHHLMPLSSPGDPSHSSLTVFHQLQQPVCAGLGVLGHGHSNDGGHVVLWAGHGRGVRCLAEDVQQNALQLCSPLICSLLRGPHPCSTALLSNELVYLWLGHMCVQGMIRNGGSDRGAVAIGLGKRDSLTKQNSDGMLLSCCSLQITVGKCI